jgi:hypothetical protein
MPILTRGYKIYSLLGLTCLLVISCTNQVIPSIKTGDEIAGLHASISCVRLIGDDNLEIDYKLESLPGDLWSLKMIEPVGLQFIDQEGYILYIARMDIAIDDDFRFGKRKYVNNIIRCKVDKQAKYVRISFGHSGELITKPSAFTPFNDASEDKVDSPTVPGDKGT